MTNKVNGKFYLGSTKTSFKIRWKCRYNNHLTAAFKLYNRHNFKFKIILVCEPKE